MTDLQPLRSGHLPVGDGHDVYWETVGNPEGTPVLYLHGGPGSGASVGQRRLFDPALHLGVIFDQRGCGRSRPLASLQSDLSVNTTSHLIADIELLRNHLQIERWLLLGLSWGTTLALAYALSHPQRVTGLVLGLVTTTSKAEVEWITQHMRRVFPAEWQRFTSVIPSDLRDMRPVDAYVELLANPATATAAAAEWCRWEDVHVSLDPAFQPFPRFQDPEFREVFARLVTHYWSNHAFLAESEILDRAPELDGIPGVMIHGRYDVSSPMETPWLLNQTWRSSELHVMDRSGHGGAELLPLVDDALRRLSN
ncbi:MAG: prolyl aminopeptidase [Acidimicrobiia bacterium]|nr:prolyl aminopeptidase [Acidimicrobiia bacterium]